MNNKLRIVRTSTSLGVCALMVGVSMSAGCEKPPTTAAEDVSVYIRNARAGATVRRLDPECQAYVDTVMEAYGATQAASKVMAKLANRKSLWALDSSEWREIETVTELRAEIVKWQEDKSDPTDPKFKSRHEQLNALNGAIAELPTLPDGSSVTLTGEIKKHLQPTVRDAGHRLLADQLVGLLTMAVDHAGSFSADAQGLVFDRAEITAQAAAAWQEIDATLKSWEDLDLSAANDIIESETALRQTALEEKQALRSDVASDPVKLLRFRRLELDFQYYDARIRWAENVLKDLAKKETKEGDTAD
jgi:hypothetical protein